MKSLYFNGNPYNTRKMTARNAPPLIFDRPAIRSRRRRAARRENSFIIQRIAEDAADRLLDIKRQFQNALIIAPADFVSALESGLPDGKIPAQMTRCHFTSEPKGLDMMIDDEALPFEAEQFDLVISVLNLHCVNDPPGALIQIRRLLKADGLFIGAMFGGETLTELRSALYAADEKITGGISPRVYPFADYSQAAQLMGRAGFALPVVDTDRFQVNYSALARLVSDLRDLGETNSLISRVRTPVSRKFREKVEDVYASDFATENGKIKVSFEILWMTGWAPHERQQKPLKPGSAKMRLADALGATEKKL